MSTKIKIARGEERIGAKSRGERERSSLILVTANPHEHTKTT